MDVKQIEQINRMRSQFGVLTLQQKKDFIAKLRTQLEGINTKEHVEFLNECVRLFNAEARKHNQQNKPLTTYAKASEVRTSHAGGVEGEHLHHEEISAAPAPARAVSAWDLAGRWERNDKGAILYYIFDVGGTFRTNEFHEYKESKGSMALEGDKLVLTFTENGPASTMAIHVEVASFSLIVKNAEGKILHYRKNDEVDWRSLGLQ